MIRRVVLIGLTVATLAMHASCGSRPAVGTAASEAQVTSQEVTVSTAQLPTSTAQPSPSSTGIAQPNVVRFVGPEHQYSVELPASFAPQGDGMVQGGGETFPNHYVYTKTFIDVANHQRITLSVERGVVSADAITSSSTPTMVYDDVRPGVTVLARVDPASKDTAMWWPADAASVVWLYGSGMTEDQLLAVLTSIEVAPG